MIFCKGVVTPRSHLLKLSQKPRKQQERGRESLSAPLRSDARVGRVPDQEGFYASSSTTSG